MISEHILYVAIQTNNANVVNQNKSTNQTIENNVFVSPLILQEVLSTGEKVTMTIVFIYDAENAAKLRQSDIFAEEKKILTSYEVCLLPFVSSYPVAFL